MKEDKNHLNGKQKISLGLLAILLLSLIGMSFAYFTAQVSGNDTAKKAKVESGTMSLALGGMKEVECLNIYLGQTCVVNFSVENTGTLDTNYAVNLKDVENTFVNKEELVYTITNQDGDTLATEITAPDIDSILIPRVESTVGSVDEYTMVIQFKETGELQNDNQGKLFSGTIQINSLS